MARQDASRDEIVQSLARTQTDVLIIGGGIVGAGIARDAALRGLRTALVEQHDFASGTSSRSSRLLHGGLRYLAQGRVGLVREAGTEKTIVQRIAPHVCEPLPFIFPTYETPLWGQWPLWKLSVGVRIYDILSGIRDFRRSRTLRVDEVTSKLPALDSRKLTGAVRYYDGLTNDSRLVIDTFRSAESAGAMLLNYCRFTGSERKSGLWRCDIADHLSNRSAQVSTRCVVNAAGPWADQIQHSSVKLHVTKGVHLVIDRARLPVPDAVVMTEGSRILFAIPWGERVILGTTDTDYSGIPEDVAVAPEDVIYILGTANRCFPGATLIESDVISSWAGLRPLIAAKGGGPSDISRSHVIRSPEPGWFDVAGGKLTTYRLMAQQTTDRIMTHIGQRPGNCATARERLLRPDAAEFTSAIIPLEPTRGLVEHFCRREWAVHLDDVMLRRGGWAHYVQDDTELTKNVAAWMAEIFGWDETRESEEIARYRAIRPAPAPVS